MAVKPEAFIALDDSLAETLSIAWGKTWKPLVRSIVKAVEADDLVEASDLIHRIELADIYDQNQKHIEFIWTTAFLFGVSRHGAVKTSQFRQQKKQTDIIEAASAQFRRILQSSSQKLRRVALQAIDDEMQRRKEVTKAEASGSLVREFVSFLSSQVGDVADNSLLITSSLHTSRLAQYGYCVEAELRGVEAYVINEQLDQRTCRLCELMHGKVYSVDVLYKRLDLLLRVEDPDALKTMAPFPPNDKEGLEKLKQMTSVDMIANGWDSPPFHPRCRGYVDDISSLPQWDIIGSSLVEAALPKARLNLVGTTEAITTLPPDKQAELFEAVAVALYFTDLDDWMQAAILAAEREVLG